MLHELIISLCEDLICNVYCMLYVVISKIIDDNVTCKSDDVACISDTWRKKWSSDFILLTSCEFY